MSNSRTVQIILKETFDSIAKWNALLNKINILSDDLEGKIKECKELTNPFDRVNFNQFYASWKLTESKIDLKELGDHFGSGAKNLMGLLKELAALTKLSPKEADAVEEAKSTLTVATNRTNLKNTADLIQNMGVTKVTINKTIIAMQNASNTVKTASHPSPIHTTANNNEKKKENIEAEPERKKDFTLS